MANLISNPFTYVWVILVFSGLRAATDIYLRRSTKPRRACHQPTHVKPVESPYDWAKDSEA